MSEGAHRLSNGKYRGNAATIELPSVPILVNAIPHLQLSYVEISIRPKP